MMENKIMVAKFIQNSGKSIEKCMAHEKFLQLLFSLYCDFKELCKSAINALCS